MDNPEIATNKNSATAHFVLQGKGGVERNSATWKMCWAIIGFLPIEPAGQSNAAWFRPRTGGEDGLDDIKLACGNTR